MHYGRGLPPRDRRGEQRAFIDEFGHHRTRLRHVQSEVVTEIRNRRYAQGLRGSHHHGALRLVLGKRRRVHVGRGQHPMEQVVLTLKVRAPTSRDLPVGEQHRKSTLGVVPPPPRPGPSLPIRNVTRRNRSAGCHLGMDALDDVRVLFRHSPKTRPPDESRVHLPPEPRQRLDGKQRCLVRPVFEELTIVEHLRKKIARVRAQAGEQRQLLGTCEHIDGVDLDEPHAIDHLAHVTSVHPTRRTRFTEPLGRQRHAPHLGSRQFDHR